MPVNDQEHNFPRPGRRLITWPGRASLFLLMVLSRIPQAQQQFEDQIQSQLESSGEDALAPSPVPAIPLTQTEQANPGTFQVFAPGGTTQGSLDQPFQAGRLIFRPHVEYRFLYGNGIQSAPGLQQKTAIQEFSPGLLINLGPNWVLDYTPTFTYYSSRQFVNGVNQSVILRGGTTFHDWVLGLSQVYTYSSSPTVETGTQVNEENYLTALSAGRQLNDVVSLSLAANQSFEVAQGYQGSRDWSTINWVNFKVTTRMNFGVGLGGGYDNVEIGPDQIYEQAQGRFNWRISDRLSVSVSGGMEDRQYRESDQPSLIDPLYGASIQYAPFDHTTLALTANSSTSQAFLVNQVTENTGFAAVLTQRLLGRLLLTVNCGYNISKYVASTPATADLSRKDDNESINTRLSWPLFKRGTAGIFYQYTHNESTEEGFTYGSTQFGCDIGYRY